MLSFADLLDNSVSGSLSLESSESVVKRFAFFNFYLTHFIPSLFAGVTFYFLILYITVPFFVNKQGLTKTVIFKKDFMQV